MRVLPVTSWHSRVSRVYLAAVGLLIAAAWLALWQSGGSAYAHHLHHGIVQESTNVKALQTGLAFVGGWTVMCIAMMLPTSLPLIGLFTVIVGQRPNRAPLVLLLCSGYLSVWAAIGGIAYGFVAAYRQNSHPAWLQSNPWLFGCLVCFIAGGFQFSAIKYACLEKCRSPFRFVTERWSGRHPRFDSLRLGWHHGLLCAGCCWALMSLMLLPGASNLGWMLALAVVMTVEKNFAWGRALVKPVGVALIASGLIIAINHLLFA